MFEQRDSYQRFIDKFNIDKESLYLFGIEETIFPKIESVSNNWDDLKKRIISNGNVTIRGYGRDAGGTDLYIGLYKHLFGNTKVKKDPTNNLVPQKIISNLTGYKSNINLLNYQVSHIFGKAKNIYLFEAAWNIVLVPKIIDPFTGHETKGIWPIEYQKLFQDCAFKKYSRFINDYNELISEKHISDGVLEYLDSLRDKLSTNRLLQFSKDVRQELSPIT